MVAVLHDYAIGGMFSWRFRDVPQFWLPTHCFLGTTLAAGEIPAWNPFKMAGEPFAADPQSGWLYAPAMLLYSALPCDVAIREHIVLNPILAGLGVYWFLRGELVSRVSSTVGGLAISVGLAGARDLLTPYIGALAWTSLALAACSRCLRAERWSRRVGWAAVTALTWGQIAGAHMSQGLLVGSAALAAYAIARTVSDVASGRRSFPDAAATLATLAAVLVPVNLAVLLPRLSYLPRSTLGVGYEPLQRLAERLGGGDLPAIVPGAVTGTVWPLRLATAGGRYLGAAPLVLVFGAFWSPRHRAVAAAFAAYSAVVFVAGLDPVVTWAADHAGSSTIVGAYLRGPNRLELGLVLGVAILGALGLEAWRERSTGDRIAMVLPGLALWGVLWAPVGIPPRLMLLPLIGAASAAPVLAASFWRPRVLTLVPAMLAVELSASVVFGHRFGTPRAPGADEGAFPAPAEALAFEPNIDGAHWMTPGPLIQEMLAGPRGRLMWLTREVTTDGETTDAQDIQRFRPILFGLEDAQGYDPVQQLSYWTFVRAVHDGPLPYNRSFFTRLPPRFVLDLLQVRWLVVDARVPAPHGWRRAAGAGTWALYERPAPPRASVYGSWTARRTPVTDVGSLRAAFRQGRVALHGPPGVPDGPRGEVGTATTVWTGTQALRIETRSSAPAVVLVRNVYDPHWEAAVDGSPAPVLRAYGFLQAIAVPSGRHVVTLRYRDPSIARGVAASAAALAAIAVAALVAAAVERRRRAATPPLDASAPPR